MKKIPTALNKKGIIIAFFYLTVILSVKAQTTIVNYDFNGATSFANAASGAATASGITTSLAGGGAVVFDNTSGGGTASGASAFTANATAGDDLRTDFSNGGTGSGKYWQFTLGGNNLWKYTAYKVYVQARRNSDGAQTLTLAYSTGGAYTNLASTMTVGTAFSEQVFDLSAIAALNNQCTVIFRLLFSGAAAAATPYRLRIDNFQVQAVNAPTAASYAYTAQSVALSDNLGCAQSSYTFSQTTDASCKGAIASGKTFTVNFPAGTDATTCTGGTYNGSAITSYTIVSATQITFTTPVAVALSTAFTFVLNGITNAPSLSAVNATSSVSNTSSGTNSGTYAVTTLACPAVTNYTFSGTSVTFCNDLRCAQPAYTITQSTTAGVYDVIYAGKTFTITFPAGSDATKITSATYNGTAIAMGTATKTATTFTFLTPVQINASTSFAIVLNNVQNGTTGNVTTSVQNKSGGTTSATYPITTTVCPAASSVTFGAASLSIASNVAGCATTYTYTQSTTASTSSAINAGSLVTITFPAGTNAATMLSGTFNGVAIDMSTVTATATQITFLAPTSMACPSTAFTIVLNSITNGASISGNSTVSVPNVTTGTDSYTLYNFTTTAAFIYGNFYDYSGGLLSYATANSNGWCNNNLTAGQTYCYNFTYPASGAFEIQWRKDVGTAPAGCGTSELYSSTSEISSAGCASLGNANASMYENICTSAISGAIKIGNSCGTTFNPGSVYSACYTVPAGCSGINICPMVKCAATCVTAEVLPVALLNFDAVLKNNVVYLNWATSSESNNKYFSVERTIDGISFQEVAMVEGAGNSSSILNYNAQDNHPVKGVSYYRLTQVDFDGKERRSKLVDVRLDSDRDVKLIKAYPNPATESLYYVVNSPSDFSFNVEVVDVLGKVVLDQTEENLKGTNEHVIDVSDISKGTYLLKITTATGVTGKLFVK